jgi:hypothetical protein
MEAMNPKDPSNRFEEYLQQIQSGRSPDEVINSLPPEDEDLRHLLRMAAMLQSMQEPIVVPPAAQNRSRAQFLAAAGQARSPQPAFSLPWLPRFRFSTALFIVTAALLCAALLGTGFVSAQTIPGDTLYPVKLAVEQARLSLAPNESSRLQMEQTFDQERVEESQRVLSIGRAESVNFAGYLHREPGEAWEVSGISVAFTPQQEALLPGLNLMYVEVVGRPQGEMVSVQSISVRLFQVSGSIQQINARQWVVNDVRVNLAPNTQLAFQPQVGDYVYISAMRQEDGSLVAMQASLSAGQEFIYLPPTPSSSPTPANTQPAEVTPTESLPEIPTQMAPAQVYPQPELTPPTQNSNSEQYDSGEHSTSSNGSEGGDKPSGGSSDGEKQGGSEHSGSDH